MYCASFKVLNGICFQNFSHYSKSPSNSLCFAIPAQGPILIPMDPERLISHFGMFCIISSKRSARFLLKLEVFQRISVRTMEIPAKVIGDETPRSKLPFDLFWIMSWALTITEVSESISRWVNILGLELSLLNYEATFHRNTKLFDLTFL